MRWQDCEDPRRCERCGHAIPDGQERGPVGKYFFLCAGCEDKCRRGRRVASARFIGIQDGYGDHPGVALFNLGECVEGNGYRHCSGSTVTRHTVESAGWELPEGELSKAADAMLNKMAQRRRIHEQEAA